MNTPHGLHPHFEKPKNWSNKKWNKHWNNFTITNCLIVTTMFLLLLIMTFIPNYIIINPDITNLLICRLYLIGAIIIVLSIGIFTTKPNKFLNLFKNKKS
jgi:hypothetical protein